MNDDYRRRYVELAAAIGIAWEVDDKDGEAGHKVVLAMASMLKEFAEVMHRAFEDGIKNRQIDLMPPTSEKLQ